MTRCLDPWGDLLFSGMVCPVYRFPGAPCVPVAFAGQHMVSFDVVLDHHCFRRMLTILCVISSWVACVIKLFVIIIV